MIDHTPLPVVLLLATDLKRGGLPLRLVRLAKSLPEEGFVPVVGCLDRPGPLSEELATAGVACFSCDARGRWDAASLARLAGHIRRVNPDLIHATLFHANLAARLVGRLDRARPIITASVTIEIERLTHRVGEALTWGLSDLHVANSQAVAEHLENDLGVAASRLRVVPNALDVAALRAAPALARDEIGVGKDEFLIVWAGRMDPIKDLPTLIGAVEIVRRRRRITAVLLGDGPHRERMESLVHEKGLEEAVRFEGWSHNVAGWLKAADALVMPSRTEGCSNVVLEAMACECLVIASEIASMRELLGGERGVLCPAGDAASFAAGLENSVPRGAAQGAMVEAARRHVEVRHEARRVHAEWGRVYREVFGR